MSVRISELYDRRIYDDNGRFVGTAFDFILNLEAGEVVRVTTEPLSGGSKDNLSELIQKKSILYKRVRAVRDIIIVSNQRVD